MSSFFLQRKRKAGLVLIGDDYCLIILLHGLSRLGINKFGGKEWGNQWRTNWVGGGGGWMNFLDFRGSGAKSSQKKMVGESNPGGCCVLKKNQAVGPLLLGFS